MTQTRRGPDGQSNHGSTRRRGRGQYPRLRDIMLAFALLLAPCAARAQVGGIAPKFLLDPNSPQAARQVAPTTDAQASVECGKDGVRVVVKGGPAGYPGITVHPESGSSWDLSPWGHVEARVTNVGTNAISLGMRVDNEGDWRQQPWNSENLSLKPGESKVAKVIFGYSYGFQPGYKLKPSAIPQVMFFLNGKSEAERAFRLEDLQASGSVGEKPPVDPNTVRTKPANGVLFGSGVRIDAAKQLVAKNGAKAALTADGNAIAVEFAGVSKSGSVTLQPAAGSWQLSDSFQVQVKFRNTGTLPISPKVRVESKGGPSDTVALAAPIPPGGEGEATVLFSAAVSPVIPGDPRQEVVGPGKWNDQNWGPKPGTGTQLVSGWAKGVTVLAGPADGVQAFLITAVVASVPAPSIPAWLGQRPPVEGDWVKTFDENFDKETLDLKTWNIYTDNFWDKRTHFSKDNVYIRDGKLVLHYEKKTGYQNDNTSDTNAAGRTDYAAGFADTYGKWVQRYGYFEARVKLPKAPGLWPAFWTMPDRGADVGPQWKRANTGSGGMEHDILEYLSGWGPFRYNMAYHWDGYGKEHKSAGSTCNYVLPDKDGFITAGLYWAPGIAVYYAQGKEVLRWESPRVCSVPSYIMFNFVSGGWDNVPLDDAKLPDDFVIDYVRVWQRKDLASPADGPKPNAGLPSSLPSPEQKK